MSLTFTTYTQQLANLMVVPTTDTNFLTFLPGCIDYSEQRIYRDLDLLNTRVVDSTGSLMASQRQFTLPTAQGTFIVVEAINVISQAVTKTPLTPVTKEFLDTVYANETVNTGVPQYFAPISDTLFLVGPAPDAAYTAEVIGTVRPTPLSSSNTTTFLTAYCPDLLVAASMVFAFGYQRDFGAMSDDPKAGTSWEAQYQSLATSARQEQLRARHEGAAWTPMEQAQIQPPRV